ncbi:MAG: hypothetical protein SVK08_09320 [Halobacteriota archaeon]|nr:hypothetical protein [Halobacteriota archaeon]
MERVLEERRASMISAYKELIASYQTVISMVERNNRLGVEEWIMYFFGKIHKCPVCKACTSVKGRGTSLRCEVCPSHNQEDMSESPPPCTKERTYQELKEARLQYFHTKVADPDKRLIEALQNRIKVLTARMNEIPKMKNCILTEEEIQNTKEG